jgi:hypothetical protein
MRRADRGLSLPVLCGREISVMSFCGLPYRLVIVALVALMALCVGSVSAAKAADPGSVFAVQDFTARALDPDGNDYTVAGGHPYEGVTMFSLATIPTAGGVESVEPAKSNFVELPPGFLGNLAGVPRCPLEKLASGPFVAECPVATQVGTLRLDTFGNEGPTVGLFNMVPERGYPFELGFKFLNNAVVVYPRLRSRAGGYGATVVAPGIADFGVTGAEVRVFGVPSQRTGVGGPQVPALINPADCLIGVPVTRMIIDSWRQPGHLTADGFPDLSDGRWKSAVAPAPPVTGCDAPGLVSQFAPELKMGPSEEGGSSQVDAPSGYSVDLTFPQSNDPTDPESSFDPATPTAPSLKDATVTLPEGVSISPSAADGLDGCSDVAGAGDQVRYDDTLPVSCPDASKVGTVVATSPLLASHDPKTDAVTGAKPIKGDVFIIKPHPGDLSPTGDRDGLFRLLIQVDSREDGVNAKIPGVVTADRVTGRLTARFENNPQVPVKHLSMTFRPGDRASLANPSSCVSAKTVGVFTPWSRPGTRSDGVAVPGTPDVTSSSIFEVSWDGKGAACPATLPFAPKVAVGLADTQAAGSSPLSFDLTREDRHDVLTGVNVSLPDGLLGAVRDVPLCSDADADAGTCPAASRIGSAAAAAGPGDHPFYLTGQPVSLTGPYKGAPYGLAIAVHAVAGPFDLGTVVVRQALNVDPDDVHAVVVSDPLPTIRDGVPFRIRRVHVDVDRPGFMRTPSACEPKSIQTTVTSKGGQTANVASPLQATGCEKLPFAPKLAMKLTNPSEAKVGGHPGLEAVVTQRRGEAATKALTVTLPLSLALDPDNAASDQLCEFADGVKGECPDKAVIGTMTANSPLLKGPLSGKVYWVKGIRTDSKSGRQIRTLPSLLVQLRGEVNVNLRGTTSVPDNQHLTSTFPTIPDAPLSSAVLKLTGGKKGPLVITDGHDDICSAPQKPFMAAIGQNGKRQDTATTMAVECPLAVVSRTFTRTSVKVKISGLGAGTVSISGPGLKTTRRTISSASTATLTAKLTSTGKRLRKAKQDVRVKVSFTPKNTKKTRVAYSSRAKAAKKR